MERIVEALRKADIHAEASDNIQRVRWTKFIFIAPYSGVGAVTRVPIGEFRACPQSRALLEQAMREVEAVAAAKGVILEPDVVAKTLAFCDGVEPRMMASMQRDVLDGKPSELDSLVGVMVRLGDELEVPVPTFRFLHGALAAPGRACPEDASVLTVTAPLTRLPLAAAPCLRIHNPPKLAR